MNAAGSWAFASFWTTSPNISVEFTSLLPRKNFLTSSTIFQDNTSASFSPILHSMHAAWTDSYTFFSSNSSDLPLRFTTTAIATICPARGHESYLANVYIFSRESVTHGGG